MSAGASGANLSAGEDDRLLIEGVREFARRELIERDREWDRTETSCCEFLPRLAGMGLLGLRIPEEFGGLALPMTAYVAAIRELAYASPSVAVTIAVHNMVADAIGRSTPAAVRSAVMTEITQPENLCAFAVSEPNAGSDAASVRTSAAPHAAGWQLNGAKMWVTNGLAARWFIVLARMADQRERTLSMFLVDGRSNGLRRTPIHGKMGIRGSETAEVVLENVSIPREHLLGDVGEGLKIALAGLDAGRMGIAAQAAGIAHACLDLMVPYAREREQYGRRIADYQAIQWMIADSRTELAAADLLIQRAALLKDQRDAGTDAPSERARRYTAEASMAKLFASEAANRIAYRAVQVHGGYGFVREFRVEQLYRDARITTLYEGTSEIQRRLIARCLLNQMA